jgi:hypothetical protein
MLMLRQSSQSGEKVMTAAYAAVYSRESTEAWVFMAGTIDLTNMQAGDTINIRIRKKVISGGSWILHDAGGPLTFTDAQPTNHKVIAIPQMPNVYGVEIAMQQTAGVLRTIATDFLEAPRIGRS